MARKIEYQIGFTADTNQLQSALQQAATALQKIGKDNSNQLTTQLRQAAQAALDLEMHLSNAYNAETGKLDLTAFQQSLQQSGLSLEEYGRKLAAIGPQGEQAFLKVAQAISAAEMPIKRSSAALDKLWITMKNTLRWQLTSGMLHGFIGAVQTAFRYTQDLNESLNSIRIVTQKSVGDMDKFAVKANEAAQTLSTTTTRYTDAALIYYQQGLDDEEVEGRVETTIKLANAAGESAEKASEQLTAIWNNFYDGSKNLEYYADVMTALGASTASSTQEISQGLQKFAAVADTVGLSYEYAAAALATVTATTRESADVVGTAFRTLFGRLESLKLGETLDDETTLKQYSEALLKVGVNIKDVNGDLKDMDDILEETGAKWQMLSRDQQMALAQTVAGVRQYAQFIALMDNWDFFQQNLQTAYGSEGTLQEQADIFAESWEAARNRVDAAAQDIYESLFDDKFFIQLDNFLTGVLHRADNLVDTMGGLGGTLNTLFNITTQLYGARMAAGIDNWVYNLQQSLGLNDRLVLSLKEQTAALIERNNYTNSSNDQAGEVRAQQTEAFKLADEAYRELMEQSRAFSEQQQETLKTIIAQVAEARDAIEEYKVAIDEAIAANEKVKSSLITKGTKNYDYEVARLYWNEGSTSGGLSQSEKTYLKSIVGMDKFNAKSFGSEQNLTKLLDEYERLEIAQRKASKAAAELEAAQKKGTDVNEEQAASLKNLKAEVADTESKIELLDRVFKEIFNISGEPFEQIAAGADTINEKAEGATRTLQGMKDSIDRAHETAQRFSDSGATLGERLVALGQGASSVYMAFNSIRSLGRVLTDEDMTLADRFTTTLMSISMLLPAITALSKKFAATQVSTAAAVRVANAVQSGNNKELGSNIFLKVAGQIASRKYSSAIAKEIGSLNAENPVIRQNTKDKLANNAATLGMATAATAALVGISALILGITAIVNHIHQARQAAQEARDALVENAQSAQETVDANRDLIKALNDALDSYDGSEESKSKLDETSRALADAYNLEGAALAKLSGKYEDYNAVAEAAIEKRQGELTNQLETMNRALEEQGTTLAQAAQPNRWSSVLGDFRGIQFIGYGPDEQKIFDAITRNTDVFTMNASGIGSSSIQTFIDPNDPNSILHLYDELERIDSKVFSRLTSEEQLQSGLVQQIQSWLKEMGPLVEKYRELELSAIEIRAALGEYGISDQSVGRLEEYYTWVQIITDTLTSQGKDEAYINQVIDHLAKTSLNSKIQELRELSQAIEATRAQVGDRDFSKFGGLEEIWKSYDKNALLLLNWRTVTQDTFLEAYDYAQKYREALDGVDEGTKQVAAAQQALKDLGDGTFSLESIAALKDGVDWAGLGENFTDFLNATYTEQQEFLNRLVSDGYNQIVQENLANIEIQKAEIERLEQEHAKYENSEELERATQAKRAYNDMAAAAQAYFDALDNDKAEDAAAQLDKYTDAVLRLNNLGEGDNLGKITIGLLEVDAKPADIQAQIDEAAEDVTLYLDQEKQFKIDEKTAQTSLQQSLDNIELTKKINFEFQLDRIRNSTDDYVAVFDAIAKGVSHSTDEMGKSFWSFSIEASEAIDAIYPGFLANAKVMEDGTFEINDAMYESFFNMLNAEVAADGNGIAAMLENRIKYLKEQRDEAQSALEIAEKLANGELTLEELKNKDMAEARDLLMKHYEEAQEIANGDMLKAEADYLEDSQGNYETLWDNVSDYSAQGAENMADNVAEGTQSVLENLKSIRDAAYGAMTAVANIGTDGAEAPPEIDTTVHWLGRGSGLLNANIDTSSTDAFVKALSEYQYQDLPLNFGTDDSDGDISRAAGRALREIYQQEINSYNKAIGAAKVAEAKLFKSIDDAYKAADKAAGADKTGAKNRAQQLKDLEKIFERYHEITREIEYQERLLKKLSTQIDRAYGADRLDLYKKKLQELNTLADLQDQKAKAAAAFITIDAETLESLGLEGDFNDHYELTNYTKLAQQAVDEYNAALKSYNARINAEGADKDALEAELKAAKDLYEDRKDALEHYENSVDTYRDLVEAWEDTQRTIEDEKLNEITYKLEVVLDIRQLKEDVRNFMKDIAESYGDALTHTLGNSRWRGVAGLMTDNAQAHIDSLVHYEEQYRDLQGLMQEALAIEDPEERFASTENIKQAMEDLTHEIINSGEALIEWLDYWENMVPDAVEAARERFNQFTDQLEHNVTVLDTIKELYALQGQTYKTQQGFDRLQRVSQERMEAQIANAELNRKWYERAAADLQKAQSELDNFNGDETSVEYDYLKKARDAFLTEFNEAQEAYLSSAQEAMETARDMYLLEIEKTVYEFGQAVSDGIGLDLLQDKYDHYIEEEERYLDKVNEAYQTASWYNKLQADIDKATTKSAKDRLKALQEEIDIRRANNQLNQYDLDILEAKYKVLQAQLALEDLQNQKTNLRLVRDRQGNWNYQYTADPDELAAAEQALLDAQNEWYNIAKQQVKDVTGEIIATWQECEEAIAEIYNDMELSDEERATRSEEIYRFYTKKIEDLTREREVAQVDMTRAGNEELEEIAIKHGEALTTIIKSDSEVLTALEGDNAKLLKLFDNEYGSTLGSMTKNSNTFEGDLRAALDKADASYVKFRDTVTDVAEKTDTKLSDLDETVNQVSQSTEELRDRGLEVVDVMWNQVDAVYAAAESYREFARSVEEAIFKLRDLAAAQAMDIEKYSGMEPIGPELNTTDALEDYSAAMTWYGFNYGTDSAGYKALYQAREEKLAGMTQEERDRYIKSDQIQYEIGALGGAWTESHENWFSDAYEYGYRMADAILDWLEKRAASGASGMYTGSWGTEGKVAILHEKEQVFNQEDTSNLLAAAEILRAIEHTLDSNGLAAQGLMAMQLSTPGVTLPQSQQLDQNIHIDEISFPNITSADGIEEAFRSLADNASQWILRNRG